MLGFAMIFSWFLSILANISISERVIFLKETAKFNTSQNKNKKLLTLYFGKTCFVIIHKIHLNSHDRNPKEWNFNWSIKTLNLMYENRIQKIKIKRQALRACLFTFIQGIQFKYFTSMFWRLNWNLDPLDYEHVN